MARVNDEDIRHAYGRTGNVWKAGELLGIAGQTVHKRLNRMGVATTTAWTPDEAERLRQLTGSGYSLPEMAIELGRTPAGVAMKMSRLGLKVERRTRPPLFLR